jgi:hypothetical protein
MQRVPRHWFRVPAGERVLHGLLGVGLFGWGAVAFLTGHPWGTLWILVPGVALHLYPVLLQRSLMLRLQPVLDRLAVAQNREAAIE